MVAGQVSSGAPHLLQEDAVLASSPASGDTARQALQDPQGSRLLPLPEHSGSQIGTGGGVRAQYEKNSLRAQRPGRSGARPQLHS